MKIIIHGTKVKVTSAMKDYIDEKVSKLDKYFENSDEYIATVNVKINKNDQIVEITIPLSNVILRSEEKKDDFYAAVDKSIDKLERQIRKNKTRMMSKKVKKIENFVFDEVKPRKTDVDSNDSKIVKRKSISPKPMNEEEAILQMELLGHDFFVYTSDVTDRICVVYKRKDGNYGVLETK